MASAARSPLTLAWLLFGFKGRIGRKSFMLSAVLMVLIQGAIIAQIAGSPEDSAQITFWALLLIGTWFASAWVMIAIAVKRLHDIGLPGLLAALLLIPAISWIGLIFLAAWPSVAEANEHGEPPFAR